MSTEYTWQEVQKHTSPQDCWLSIHGKVYDVTDWLVNHPGGADTLLYGAGRDSSIVFDTYHKDLEAVQPILKKYEIGVLVSDELPTFDESVLYPQIKKRVYAYFEEKNIDPKWNIMIVLRYLLIWSAIIIPYFLGYYYFENIVIQSILMLILGWGGAMVGLVPLHDCSHFSFTHNPLVWRIVGATHDFFNGASYLVWIYQHTMGHHPYTNVVGVDPDVETGDPDIRRIKPSQKWYQHYIGQHIYVPILYGLLAWKTRYQDFVCLITRLNGVIRTNSPERFHLQQISGGKTFFIIYRILIPLFFLPAWKVFFLLAIADFITSYWLAFAFQANHVVTDAEWYHADQNNKIVTDWVELQIRSTQGYAHDSFFTTFLTGALNFQATHHLFPEINQYYYPEIGPIVRDFCKEVGIDFIYLDTFPEAIGTHFGHLKNLGQNPKER
eukprot:TRINITY_DN163_c1_g1_i1.p1 TRINITY_DN163_c1_g1~~TRINITY_DN163_c1_g1_i1.p1  ORF type:complete len:439 (-),score=64.60 TRINITY_DN163_c1_g1_i1:52-1368(-)